MVYRIGGENIVALAFSQLLKENKLKQYDYITYEQLEDYRQRAQKFFEEEARYDVDFYDIYRTYSFIWGWNSILANEMDYLLYIPPLEFIAKRNHNLFRYKEDEKGNECIYLNYSFSYIVLESKLQELWSRNNKYACYVMLEKIKFIETED